MKFVFDENQNAIDLEKITLVSNQGGEYKVYKHNGLAIKVLRYAKGNLSKDDINYLRQIDTKRILMPNGTLTSEDGTYVGYTMPLITDAKNFQAEKMSKIFSELEIIEQDINKLSKKLVMMYDLRLINSIFNGELYVIDPGHFAINDLDILKVGPAYKKLNDVDKTKAFNSLRISRLLYSFLFVTHGSYNYDDYKAIMNFFDDEMDLCQDDFSKLKYCLEAFKKHLDGNLTVNDAVEKLISSNPHLKR